MAEKGRDFGHSSSSNLPSLVRNEYCFSQCFCEMGNNLPLILLLPSVLRRFESEEAILSVTAAVRGPDDHTLRISSPALWGGGVHLKMSRPDTASLYNHH